MASDAALALLLGLVLPASVIATSPIEFSFIGAIASPVFYVQHSLAVFAGHTSKASPAMLGGYEYTPEAMNARPEELLRDKHNESLLVMPRIFSEAGYNVRVGDPPFSNYEYGLDPAPFNLKDKKLWVLDRSKGYAVHDNIFEEANWQRLDARKE